MAATSGELRLNMTRVDANELVDELMRDINFTSESNEASKYTAFYCDVSCKAAVVLWFTPSRPSSTTVIPVGDGDVKVMLLSCMRKSLALCIN